VPGFGLPAQLQRHGALGGSVLNLWAAEINRDEADKSCRQRTELFEFAKVPPQLPINEIAMIHH
jgi:hypothetical protein